MTTFFLLIFHFAVVVMHASAVQTATGMRPRRFPFEVGSSTVPRFLQWVTRLRQVSLTPLVSIERIPSEST